MSRYESDKLGVLKYSDFCESIFPKTSEYSNLVSSRIPSYKQVDRLSLDKLFSFQTRMLFRQVLKDLFRKEASTEHMRQTLSKRPFFSTYEQFKNLDKTETGYINKVDLKKTLEEYGVFSTKQDLNNLVEDFTQSKTDNISYSDFM